MYKATTIYQLASDGMSCSCGARCLEPKDKKRFARRHPKTCSSRRAFNVKLSEGTRCLDEVEGNDKYLEMVRIIDESGRGLTEWELNFMEHLHTVMAHEGWYLSENRAKSLTEIFNQRVEHLQREDVDCH